MSTQENEACFGRLLGGDGSDSRRRLNETIDHTFGANKPSEAAKRQAAGLVPDRGPATQSQMAKKGRTSEEALKGSFELQAHGNRCPSPHRTESIRSRGSSSGSTTTRSSTVPNTMSDSLWSLYTAPASPTFDDRSQCSCSNYSNMTSMNTSPNPSRKNTIDERLDDFVLEGNEVKRAKTEHYGTSAASTEMATDVLAHFPTHSRSFPLTNTYLVDRNWPELVHMEAGMDSQWKNGAPPRRPKSGFLALTPDERAADSRVGPLPKVGSTDLPLRAMKFSNPVPDPAPDEEWSQDKHTSGYSNPRSPCSSNNTPATHTPAPPSLLNTPSPPPKTEGSPILTACDSYGDAYYDVMCQAIHNIILERTPTAVLDDLEKPLEMAAVWCTEKAINLIQEKLFDISCAEKIVTDHSEGSLEDSGHGSYAPSNAASASTSQKHARAKKHGESSNRQGDDESEDDTNNGQNQEGSRIGRQDHRHLSKRDRNGFSCPFRKRNPLRFNIRDWSNCALQPYDNITLLKRHIKVCHQSEIVCPRCKKDMGSSERVDQHLMVPLQSMCELVTEAPVTNPEDGITREIDEKLCARGNGRKVDTWAVLWQTLFPNDDYTPSHEFEPPVGLEEVVNKFNSQQLELPPLGAGGPRLRARLHAVFDASYLPDVDPDHCSNLANDVCQQYINETLEACAKIPDEKSLYVDGPLRKIPSRLILTPIRPPKKSGKAASRQAEQIGAPALIPRHIPVNLVSKEPTTMTAAVNWDKSSRPSPFPGISDAPFPGLQNPVAGYLNSATPNVQNQLPSLSGSTTSSGSMTQPRALHGPDTPRFETSHAARDLAGSHAFAYQPENSVFGTQAYMLGNVQHSFNPSDSGYPNPLPATNHLRVHTSEFIQPQTNTECVIPDTLRPFKDCIDFSQASFSL
ncbi:hypothetical protein MCOR25_007174 [Pyricularia grisea]|uniref:Uncharacterized protein n=1 Tax=Pyricularia grisea TaxID=148305 RepID=A0A6P8BJ38_PYRGI|nr:uncharacterized protein PgNI_01645 [Pyricularia grisea]KAI6359079.1 hypothetical protein MCOR25_007174 [Pyricularia grisea]TLD16921.1 hypothetical protein PgNI_01645 [Pyricularia grisea]